MENILDRDAGSQLQSAEPRPQAMSQQNGRRGVPLPASRSQGICAPPPTITTPLRSVDRSYDAVRRPGWFPEAGSDLSQSLVVQQSIQVGAGELQSLLAAVLWVDPQLPDQVCVRQGWITQPALESFRGVQQCRRGR